MGLGMLAAVSCTKESDEMENTNQLKSDLVPEAPYEIYLPQGEAYLELESGLVEYLGGQASFATCELSKGIWLWETGINYWFPSPEFAEENSFISSFDEEIIDERSVQMSLLDGEFSTADLREEFISTYEDVSSRVSQGFEHAFTDVQFVELQSDVMLLKIRSVFYSNPGFSQYSGTPTVPSATMDKKVGRIEDCNHQAVGQGAWRDATVNVKSVLPRPTPFNSIPMYSNLVSFTTDLNNGSRKYINGEYLPGTSQAIFPAHSGNLNEGTCLYIVEQNAYAQAMANQIDAVIGKQQYWDGVSSFSVNLLRAQFNNECNWYYNLTLAKHFTYPEGWQKLTPLAIL